MNELATRAAHRPDGREVLADGKAAVLPALRAAVDRLPEQARRIAGYHLGWHGGPGRAGKAIRPALTLLCAEAAGGSAVDALPAAVAVELAHNFVLMHADVIDGAPTRRHRPAVWQAFDIGEALLTGSALQALAFDVLASSAESSEARTLAAALQDLPAPHGTGRPLENPAGALFECACVLGASAGGGSPRQVDELRLFGARLGSLYRASDRQKAGYLLAEALRRLPAGGPATAGLEAMARLIHHDN
ncbi:polyprenyl synthetase family protein [Amycolatopsis nigrescens]|uniref:polyprenyl synthetase family protein n=1 Tax=Amycolatopsis nigrescens TaxID=381445 RepID=UPI0003657D6A|nr:polyprenyl synthetase family protein [Amycolatopsis nigrescens]